MTLTGAGHVPHVTHPAEWVAIVEEFASRAVAPDVARPRPPGRSAPRRIPEALGPRLGRRDRHAHRRRGALARLLRRRRPGGAGDEATPLAADGALALSRTCARNWSARVPELRRPRGRTHGDALLVPLVCRSF